MLQIALCITCNNQTPTLPEVELSKPYECVQIMDASDTESYPWGDCQEVLELVLSKYSMAGAPTAVPPSTSWATTSL